MFPRSNAGLYFLLIRLSRRVQLTIRKKEYSLPAGYYIYTGSAQRYLRQRIRRHCSHRKKKHWHIDYLLEHGGVVDVRIMANVPRQDEPQYAGEWAILADGIPIPQFGASDSPAVSHLAWFKTRKKITSSPIWQAAHPFLNQ
jgi:Uri superfamily endonuclease